MKKNYVFYTNESFAERDEEGKVVYRVARVERDVSGYYDLGYRYRSLEDAETYARLANESMGISENDVFDVVASSMRASRKAGKL